MPIGSSFDDFLEEEGIREETEIEAIKQVLSWKLQQAKIPSKCINIHTLLRFPET
jgi:hypothetical protein